MPARRARSLVVRPRCAVAGARIDVEGGAFPFPGGAPPEVHVGGARARLAFAARARLGLVVPEGLEGRQRVRVAGVAATGEVEVARVVADGVHQVDNVVVDRAGNLFVTYSGTRGERVPVSIFRVRPDGVREAFVTGILNPTSMVMDAGGDLLVSSRFEGTVYRVRPDGTYSMEASELGVACGLAFDAGGRLLVGDRSGSILRLGPGGTTTVIATLPPSIAAFHLASGPDGWLYVTGPTLNSYDHVYRVDPDGRVEVFATGFGRPQGIAVDRHGVVHVCDAVAGSSGVLRLADPRRPERLVSGPSLLGLAFDGDRGLIVCSSETVYRFDAVAKDV